MIKSIGEAKYIKYIFNFVDLDKINSNNDEKK